MAILKINITDKARVFCREHGIDDITFNLFESAVSGCCVGFVKEIEPVYSAPENASGYWYCRVEDFHIFISRKIKIPGSITLATEGIWKKRLCLNGATIPL